MYIYRGFLPGKRGLEMENEIKKVRKKFLPYTNDIIAKSLLIGEDENSNYIRNSNCEVALGNGKKVVFSRVLNVELLPTASGGKMIKMDVRAEDEDGNLYDIEIQNH